ncbi:MAG: DUF4388 domain-containing protein [Nostocaceae cyanobacterium]|nr:DUF4388 domain-containing protein [Nostocaceae cyanobacterium]
MSLSSSFRDFSLAELFQLIDQGRKSGCLTVCTLPDTQATEAKSYYYYIWFRQGRVIAAANRLDGHGLVTKILERHWLSQPILIKLCSQIPTETPLGLHLKTQGALNSEQLNLLFAGQLQQVRNLFEIQKGVFKLDCRATLPWSEMTGLSVGTIEVALMALRAMKNWQVLADALPGESSALKKMQNPKLQVRLNAFEWQVWELAKGNIPLKAIADQVNQSTAKVQQAAFRLILAGLAEEVPLVTSNSNMNERVNFNYINPYYSLSQKSPTVEQSKVSTSFLQSLVGFLRSKV